MRFLIPIIMFCRRQWCRVAKHNWQFTGIYGTRPGGDKYEKVPQCVRCGGLKWKPKVALHL